MKPVLDDEVDVAHGSRVLGDADPNSRSRELGIVFFNQLVSFITRTKVSDCSNGYRAVRTSVLPQLVLRQEQFHTSEFLIEAIKRGIPAKEVPVTVVQRTHGHSKKPAVVRYGLGLRQRDRPHLAALAAVAAAPRRGPAGRGRCRSAGRPGRRASACCCRSGSRARARRPRSGRGSRRQAEQRDARCRPISQMKKELPLPRPMTPVAMPKTSASSTY